MIHKLTFVLWLVYVPLTLSSVVDTIEHELPVNATFERLLEQKKYWGIDHLFAGEEHMYKAVPTPAFKTVHDLVQHGKGYMLHKNSPIKQIPDSVNEFIISAVVYPMWRKHWYANIFTFIGVHKHWGQYGNRNPGLWFCPNSFHIYVASGYVKDGRHETNVFMVAPKELKQNKDNWIVIYMRGDAMVVYIDGEVVGQKMIPLAWRPKIEGMWAWAADPFHAAAGAILKDLKMFVLNDD